VVEKESIAANQGYLTSFIKTVIGPLSLSSPWSHTWFVRVAISHWKILGIAEVLGLSVPGRRIIIPPIRPGNAQLKPAIGVPPQPTQPPSRIVEETEHPEDFDLPPIRPSLPISLITTYRYLLWIFLARNN
jgi:hypothetical protein